MAALINITQVNELSSEQFEWMFENVVELCTDAASQVKTRRPFRNLAELCGGFHEYLDGLTQEEKLVVLQLHPDLAGKLAARGELTPQSSGEQRSAGLDQLSSDQKCEIDLLNQRYKAKFGFPFIICARENKVQSIIAGLQQRYSNSREQEICHGINEVKKICSLRILDIVKD